MIKLKSIIKIMKDVFIKTYTKINQFYYEYFS